MLNWPRSVPIETSGAVGSNEKIKSPILSHIICSRKILWFQSISPNRLPIQPQYPIERAGPSRVARRRRGARDTSERRLRSRASERASERASQPAGVGVEDGEPTDDSGRQCTPGCRHERMAYVVARATTTTLASWFSFLSRTAVARRSSRVTSRA